MLTPIDLYTDLNGPSMAVTGADPVVSEPISEHARVVEAEDVDVSPMCEVHSQYISVACVTPHTHM